MNGPETNSRTNNPKKKRIAGIDIGTNAIRILIAEPGFGPNGGFELRRVCELRRITRLGEGLIDSGKICGPAMERTVAVLKEYAALIGDRGVDEVTAVATSAVREAENGREFVRRVEQETGIAIEIINGMEEARRTLVGIQRGLQDGESGKVIRDFHAMDIGGGSTEWIVVRGGKFHKAASVKIGVVKLADRFLGTDPLGPGEADRLLEVVREAIGPTLEDVLRDPGWSREDQFVGTAGTVTTLAALEKRMEKYEPAAVHLQGLSLNQVRSWYDKLSRLSMVERRGLPGLERGREDLIIPGTALLLGAMEAIGAEDVIVCDWGLREGLVVDRFEKNQPG